MKKSAQNDTELWELVQQNKQDAYQELYWRYVDIIFAGIYKHIPDRQHAEDLTQEVFLSLWEQRHKIHFQYRFFSYLYSIARYKTYKYIRDRKLIHLYVDQWEAFDTAEALQAAPDAFRVADLQLAEEKISDEIAALPPQMKKVYQLKIEMGLSISEIAGQLVISEHTVKKHLAMIKKRLRSVALQLW